MSRLLGRYEDSYESFSRFKGLRIESDMAKMILSHKLYTTRGG